MSLVDAGTANGREVDRTNGARGRGGVRTAYLIKQVELAVRALLDDRMTRHNLTALQYTALSVLDRNPGMYSSQLGRRSFVTPQAATEMVRGLERKGLVERIVHDDNRRVVAAHLTPLGRRVLAECDEDFNELEAHMLRNLSPAGVRQMRGALESCLGSLQELLADE
jgi:DNA-binding MarR family transcriptional regulator